MLDMNFPGNFQDLEIKIFIYMKHQDHVWQEDKLIKKDCCFECGNGGTLDFHHVIPKSLGGKMAIPLCAECHGLVHNSNFLQHRKLQRIGIEKAKKKGIYKGRNNGTKESTEKFLNKPIIKKVVKLLNEGYNGVEISKIVGVHTNTITKVRKVASLY